MVVGDLLVPPDPPALVNKYYHLARWATSNRLI